MAPHPDKKLEHALYMAFLEWFRDSGVDFWNECNAPEDLARIGADIVKKMIEEM